MEVRKKALIGIVLVWALGLAQVTLAQETAKDKLDVAGIRIGMTEAETMNALKAFDPSTKVTRRSTATFSYSDGVNIKETPEFLDLLEVATGKNGTFSIWFASPPSASVVYAVKRRSNVENPITGEQFVASLVGRYGPVGVRSPSSGWSGPKLAQWDEAGKVACTVGKDKRTGQRVPAQNTTGTLLPPNAPKVLEQQARQQVPHLREAMGNAIDVSRCGTVLRYEWISEPVREFEAWLVDQGGMIAINRQSAKWVEQQKTQGTRDREAKGQAPKL